MIKTEKYLSLIKRVFDTFCFLSNDELKLLRFKVVWSSMRFNIWALSISELGWLIFSFWFNCSESQTLIVKLSNMTKFWLLVSLLQQLCLLLYMICIYFERFFSTEIVQLIFLRFSLCSIGLNLFQLCLQYLMMWLWLSERKWLY